MLNWKFVISPKIYQRPSGTLNVCLIMYAPLKLAMLSCSCQISKSWLNQVGLSVCSHVYVCMCACDLLFLFISWEILYITALPRLSTINALYCQMLFLKDQTPTGQIFTSWDQNQDGFWLYHSKFDSPRGIVTGGCTLTISTYLKRKSSKYFSFLFGSVKHVASLQNWVIKIYMMNWIL